MFNEFVKLKLKLDAELATPDSLVDKPSIKNMLAIINDVLTHKLKSKYVHQIDPYDAVLSNASQIRASTIQTDNLNKITDSIIRKQAVTQALLLHENPTSSGSSGPSS